MPGLKGKPKISQRRPDLMASSDFRAEKARNGLEYKDFPMAPITLRKILAGDPSATFLALIVAGAMVGMEPHIVWKPTRKD